MRYTIKNLVFKGGGVLGVAYAGAVEVLSRAGILAGVENLAGTSAGAIASLLLSLRYDEETLKKILLDLDFKQFTSKAEPLRFQDRYGWHSTQPVREWLEDQVRKSRQPGELSGRETFQDFKDLGCRNMHVFATNLNTRSVEEFSVRRTPEVRVVDAVLASLSIPAYFQSFQFPDGKPNSHIYVDGGALLNYPITAFDTPDKNRRGALKANPDTIGFHLELLGHEFPTSDLEFGTFSKWAQTLYETVKDVQSTLLLSSPEHMERTVFIDNGGISPIDFEITPEQKTWLIESGRQATEAYLQLYRYRKSFRSRALRSLMRWRTRR
ncbi:MAG TPA: patatin-like phospholipase family protein [Leptospiraceae bacterium]|jgi:NTE family protein|nr:patatin-like phospholipase family protein [Leptospirales bacterium]HMU85073.1 patatin-like phospholipase family protein [Leptospiraceae bacterium]HMW59771.1 patatin-like phospholipase family protein [Leptospiraceae bacterium]HMX54904.1 patatin-like phospholipase family protein [Leptospiraceae bacterium]HMY44690.1 patatin-like phospholipase family protein [Leptospiraceae bacterium]